MFQSISDLCVPFFISKTHQSHLVQSPEAETGAWAETEAQTDAEMKTELVAD